MDLEIRDTLRMISSCHARVFMQPLLRPLMNKRVSPAMQGIEKFVILCISQLSR